MCIIICNFLVKKTLGPTAINCRFINSSFNTLQIMQFLYLVLVFFLVICCKYTSSISQFTECEGIVLVNFVHVFSFVPALSAQNSGVGKIFGKLLV